MTGDVTWMKWLALVLQPSWASVHRSESSMLAFCCAHCALVLTSRLAVICRRESATVTKRSAAMPL